jgi:hypothetical protein
MFVVHALGNSSPFNEYEIRSLEEFWSHLRTRENQAITEAKEQCNAWVQNFIEAAIAKEKSLPEDQKSTTPVDDKETTGEADEETGGAVTA